MNKQEYIRNLIIASVFEIVGIVFFLVVPSLRWLAVMILAVISYFMTVTVFQIQK